MQPPTDQYVPLAMYQQVLAQLADLQARLAWFERQLFGAKSERFVPDVPGQLALDFGGDGQMSAALEAISTEEAARKSEAAKERAATQKNGNHRGRTELPGHLPRVEEVIEPEGDLEGLVRIGEDITEVLEYEAGKMWVRRTVRPRYARPAETGAETGARADRPVAQVLQAPAPDGPFPRHKAGASVLVHLLIAKFVDHLPLYRISGQFARQGVKISDSTFGQWVQSAADHLLPLYKVYEKRVFEADYLQMDETTLRVLEEGKKGKCHLGYLWAVFDPVNKRPFFFYQKGRDHKGPKERLANFAGTLQCDGYSVYETLDKKLDAIRLCNCMSHIRREFFEARDNDKPRAEAALTIVRALYAIEEEARRRQLDHAQRLALRLEKAKPLFDALGEWLESTRSQVLPKSKIGQAVAYALARWTNMARYLGDGALEIDNNLVENAIRPIAIGRKNYLFAGSHEAAQRIAMLYSFFAACKHHGINPEVWLSDVLDRMYKHPVNQLDQLLPHNWTPPETKPGDQGNKGG
jgi:transposase